MKHKCPNCGHRFEDNAKESTLRDDAARLDWLEGQVHRGFYNPATGRTELSEFSCHEIKTHGIRAAIDAARRGVKP